MDQLKRSEHVTCARLGLFLSLCCFWFCCRQSLPRKYWRIEIIMHATRAHGNRKSAHRKQTLPKRRSRGGFCAWGIALKKVPAAPLFTADDAGLGRFYVFASFRDHAIFKFALFTTCTIAFLFIHTLLLPDSIYNFTANILWELLRSLLAISASFGSIFRLTASHF